MCGRVRLSSDVSEIRLVFSIPPDRPVPNIAPSWNVAPTDPLPMGCVGRPNRMSAGPLSDAEEVIE
jgi:putative SOS response-associated peptidase YedK